MRYVHTEKTAAIFNSLLKEYMQISCDSDLEKIGIEYEEYRNSGFFIDQLRYDGKGITGYTSVARWSESHGCAVTDLGNGNWLVSLEKED